MVLVVKNLPANSGDIRDVSSVPESRSPGGGNGNPLQYSCLENPRQRSLAGYGSQSHRESDMAEVTEHTHMNIGVQLQFSLDICLGVRPQDCMFALAVQSLSCVQLCDPMNYSPSCSSVHGISQAKILEWVSISSSRGSS